MYFRKSPAGFSSGLKAAVLQAFQNKVNTTYQPVKFFDAAPLYFKAYNEIDFEYFFHFNLQAP